MLLWTCPCSRNSRLRDSSEQDWKTRCEEFYGLLDHAPRRHSLPLHSFLPPLSFPHSCHSLSRLFAVAFVGTVNYLRLPKSQHFGHNEKLLVYYWAFLSLTCPESVRKQRDAFAQRDGRPKSTPARITSQKPAPTRPVGTPTAASNTTIGKKRLPEQTTTIGVRKQSRRDVAAQPTKKKIEPLDPNSRKGRLIAFLKKRQ